MSKHFFSMVCTSLLLAGCGSAYETGILSKQAKLDAISTAKDVQIAYADCYSPAFDSSRDNCFRQIDGTHHGRKAQGVSTAYANAYDNEAADRGFIAIANDLGHECDDLAKNISVGRERRKFRTSARVFYLACKNGNTISLTYDEHKKTWSAINGAD